MPVDDKHQGQPEQSNKGEVLSCRHADVVKSENFKFVKLTFNIQQSIGIKSHSHFECDLSN